MGGLLPVAAGLYSMTKAAIIALSETLHIELAPEGIGVSAYCPGPVHSNIATGKVYELGGDEGLTLAELAAEVRRVTGRKVVYRDLPVADYAQALVAAGLPEPYARSLANSDLGVARGDLHITSGDLARLIGRPAVSMPQAIQEAATAAGLAA
jgi:uncharacterized protein YbjT (DUF2867 family)